MQKNKNIQIDGRHGEGGGQILRTALALSALQNIPVYINHIRGSRKRPGLRPQHLAAVTALATITGGKVEGNEVGSPELCFEPGEIREGRYCFHIGTAGSTGLVLQAVIPALLFSKIPSHVMITGGTHAPWSPCFHYLRDVFLPVLKKMGGDVSIEIDFWGWYPRGGGRIRASIYKTHGLRALNLSRRGRLRNLHILSAVSNLPLAIAERQLEKSLRRIEYLKLKPAVSIEDAPSPGQGTALFVAAEFQGSRAGFTSLGKKRKPAEQVADDACNELIEFLYTEAALDCHLADQLVLYMALAGGRSTVSAERITEHLLTNIWVIEHFMPVKFFVDKELGTIEVNGIGL